MPPDKATVVSFSTSEAEMVTERVLTIELDSQTLVTVECTADILLGDFEEKHKISSSSPAYTHSLRLRGLLPETAYTCTTVSAEQNATVDFTTGSLPSSLTDRFHSPTGTPPPGFMLLNTFDGPSDDTYWLMIQDYWGNIRWYVDARRHGTGILAVEHEPDAGGIITGGGYTSIDGAIFPPSVYDLSGELIASLDDSYGDHDIDYIDRSLYFPVHVKTISCVQRWSLDTSKQTWEWCASNADGYNINSLAVTEDESAILITTYAPSEGVVKIDTNSGNTVWRLNPDGTGSLSVDSPIPGIDLQHDIAFVDCEDGEYDLCFVVYDNGKESRGYSQILSYGIDETKMSATLIRSFSRKGWYEGHSGGIHQMPNGEWLISMASVTSSSQSSYLMIDKNNNELWEMASKNEDVGAYRARHIDPCHIFNHTGMCPE
jgi:hypothetical protein